MLCGLAVVGSEDCLYLNVYSPGGIHEELDENNTFPVVVFIHGEQGADPKYHPGSKMAGEMDVLFVTLQYRCEFLTRFVCLFLVVLDPKHMEVLVTKRGSWGCR